MDGAFDPGSTSWVVTSIDEEPLLVDDPPTIGFDDEGHVSGGAGVNRFMGTWSLAGNVLVVGPLATTRMAGPPERMDLERRFLDVLAARCTVTRTDGGLLLTSDGGSLRLAPASAEGR
ncbi:MAG TPA: META domain-containing protein [Actinomycetota bacterium]|nr:META domain-containing protein [Actinomycetota bacterium]